MYGKLRSPHNYAKIKSPKILSIDQINKLLKQNPYNLPSDDTLLQIREKNILENKKQLEKRAKTRIEYRGLDILPNLSEKKKSFLAQEEETIKPVAPERQRRQQMSGYIDQTRDILLSQIKIDRKRKEIERIKQLQKTEKGIIQQEIAKIAETNNQYEMTMNSIKSQATRARSEMEQAINQKQRLQKQLKALENSISKIKAEITKNEDIVFQYRNYHKFLQKLTPEGENTQLYFQHPDQLIQELEQMENENLFLIQEIKDMERSRDRAVDEIRSSLSEASKEQEEIDAKWKKVTMVDPIDFDNSGVLRDVDAVDQELNRLTKIVKSSYSKCYSNKTDLTPVMMLERLENGLEKLYQIAAEIPDSFIIEEQAIIDKERREKQRVEKQKEKQRQQKMKIAAAVERSKKPVKKRTGRPLRARYLPIVHAKVKSDDQKLLDEAKQEQLLFGPITD